MANDIWAGVSFGDSVVNPGSVYTTGGTPTAPPPSYSGAVAANAALYPGVAPAVATPNNLPAGNPYVANANGAFVPLTKNTAYVNGLYGPQPNTDGLGAFTMPKVPTVINAAALGEGAASELQSKINQSAIQGQATTLKNPGIAQANPTAIANPNFINALYAEQYNRPATQEELNKFAGRTVKDAANIILGATKSPFFQGAVPGGNDKNPESQQPAAPEVAALDGTIDLNKWQQTMTAGLKSINDLIAQEREAFDNSINEIGNQPGTTMPLLQGDQAYQERRKEIRMQRLVDEKTQLVEAGNLQFKVMEYANTLRKDQQDALAGTIEMFLGEGIDIPDAMAQQYASLSGINPQAFKDGLAAAVVAKAKSIALDNAYKQAQIDNASKPDLNTVGTDEEGNPIFGSYDPSTKTWKPIVISGSSASFTDANGTAWNVAGWAANDKSKQASMQAIADKIGKVTDANIEEKVKQFTPGLTADMIRKSSEKSGVSWEAIMTMAAQESLGGNSNVAKKNNNYGGLTFNNQEWIKEFGGSKGTARPAAEGGNYIKFATPQAGLDAMAVLMAQYGTVNVDTKKDSQLASVIAQVKSGKVKISEVADEPKGFRNKVIAGLGTDAISNPETTAKLKDMEAVANSVLNDSYLKNIIGANKVGRFSLTNWVTGDKQTVISNLERLISNESLKSLIEAKAQGATFGALSDKELDILSSAATSLAGYRVYDDAGKKVIGYQGNQDDFIAEIKRLRDSYSNLLEANGVSSVKDIISGTTPGNLQFSTGQITTTPSNIGYEIIND